MAGDDALAYVFWHWKRPGVGAEEYEARQRAFHAALAAAGPPGFRGSFAFALPGIPWAGDGAPVYEDWYVLDGYAALGRLNEAAVSGTVVSPHDAAAAPAAGGMGGLYALRDGSVPVEVTHACWLDKPAGVPYAGFVAGFSPRVVEAGGALWMRQLVLGPAREFCIHAPHRIEIPDDLRPLWVPLRKVWPEDGA